MGASDLQTIITTNWDTNIIALGTVRVGTKLPVMFINNGICISDEIDDMHPSGFTQQQTDAFGGEIYRLYLIDSTKANIRLRRNAIVKIADTFTSTAIYTKLYPRANELVFLKTWNEQPIPDWWHVAEMPILCSRNNINIYT